MPSFVSTNILLDVWLLLHLTGGLLDAALAPSGLSADEFGLYSVLTAGPTTPTRIAQWTGMRPTTLSAALKRVERRGDLTRQPNPPDARSFLVLLTPQGTARHRAAQADFARVLESVHAALADELPTVRLSLERLDTALRQFAQLPPRPYQVGAEPAATSSGVSDLLYTGPALTVAQEAEARQFVDWLRWRRAPHNTE